MKPELTAIVPVERVLELARRYPVFPCRRKDETDQEGRTLKAKSPLTKNGFKDATQDEAQIRRLWAAHPDALVGVPTGSRTGLAVIDFDTSKAGVAAQEWLSENQGALLSTRVHQTGGGSGGRHYLFKLPAGVKIRGGANVVLGKVKRDGLDIRAEGGYIIWWPLHFGQSGPLEEVQPLPAGLIDERRMDLELPAEVAAKVPPKPGTSGDFQRELRRITEALVFIDPADYDPWLMVGMALHHASGGADDGLELWDAWSSGCVTGVLPDSYAGRADIEYRWQSFHLDRGGGVTLGSLFNAAKSNGWVNVPEAVRLGPPKREEPEDFRSYENLPEALGMERVREPQIVHTASGQQFGTVTPSGTVPSRRLILRPIGEIVTERREASWLIHNVLEANVLAVLAGPRASFKSFIALDWAMRIAAADNPVVILSGEGAGLGRRAEAWMQEHGKGRDLEDLRLMALESVANLNAEEEMAMLQSAIDEAGIRPALVVVDTFSKFSAGLDENSNQEVAEYLSKLTIGLRERYTATVLLVAHSGHGDAKRPRGASALMANPDAEYIVERPDAQGMAVNVTRERFKDTASMSPIGYEAVEVDLGRVDRYGEGVKSLVMRATDPVVATKKATPQGKVQKMILDALRARQRASETTLIWTMVDLRQVGKECGQSKQSVHRAVEMMAMSPFLTSTVGGFRLSEEGLK
jgi:AAA domain/Bifunctional DNA primase/polymerase, N-terminal/Primase C terminal 2 (PriCT-2)